MAQINDFLSHTDFEAMSKYCMASGMTVHYAKGDCFADADRGGRKKLCLIGIANRAFIKDTSTSPSDTAEITIKSTTQL